MIARSFQAMNIHHLELFYHVARCEGVSAAARQMSYGIQQSTISAQVLQLEDSLGKVLFRRRPFELTEEGRILFDFITPFFSGLEPLGERIRGGAASHLRIACPEIVQRDYLPALLSAVRKRIPDFHFSLESGRGAEIKQRLRAGHIDLGLATLEETSETGIDCQVLLELPMVLLVPAKSEITDAGQILGLDRIEMPLITLPGYEPACRVFQKELQRRGVDWFPALELAGMDLIFSYVAAGFGAGLCLQAPGWVIPDDLRLLKLEGFPVVQFGALTCGPVSAVASRFIVEAETVARALSDD